MLYLFAPIRVYSNEIDGYLKSFSSWTSIQSQICLHWFWGLKIRFLPGYITAKVVFYNVAISLGGVLFKRSWNKNTPDFKIYGLLFSHFITLVKKVRGVFKINATSSIFCQLSDLLLSTLQLTWMKNAVAFSTHRCNVSEFNMCSHGFFQWWQSWFTISEVAPRAV